MFFRTTSIATPIRRLLKLPGHRSVRRLMPRRRCSNCRRRSHASATHSVFVPGKTTTTTTSTESRNRGSSFGKPARLHIGSRSCGASIFTTQTAPPILSAILPTCKTRRPPLERNQLVSMGLNNNQSATAIAAVSSTWPASLAIRCQPAADPDGGPAEVRYARCRCIFQIE